LLNKVDFEVADEISDPTLVFVVQLRLEESGQARDDVDRDLGLIEVLGNGACCQVGLEVAKSAWRPSFCQAIDAICSVMTSRTV